MILKQLKAEALNMIHIHATESALRRACSRGTIKVVEATDTLPRLHYVTDERGQHIHALHSDLTKFLMLTHIEDKEAVYSLLGIKANWVRTEEDYNKFVDAEYRKQYTWAESEPSMPWLVVNFEKPEVEETAADSTEETEETEEAKEPAAETKPTVTLKISGAVFNAETCANVGTVAEDGKSLEMQAGDYVMFEAKKDLNLTGAVKVTVEAEAEDAIYTAEAE